MRLLSNYDVGLALTQPTCINNRLGIPTKIFDYLLAGLAIISTNTPGLKWIGDAAQVGLTYTPGDTRTLGDNINRLARNGELLRQLKKNARAAALESYNWDLEKQKLLSLYREMIQ